MDECSRAVHRYFHADPLPGSVDNIVAHDIDLGEREIAMVFDAAISTPDANVEAKIHSFPDVEEFVAMLNDM